MIKKIIKADKAPQPIGPYHQAVATDHLVFTAGQIAIDPATNQICTGGIAEQTRMVLTNLKVVLEAAGSSLDKVLKVTIFLKDMDDFPIMNTVYGEFFKSDTAPARATVEVSRLPKDALVEIEAVAGV